VNGTTLKKSHKVQEAVPRQPVRLRFRAGQDRYRRIHTHGKGAQVDGRSKDSDTGDVSLPGPKSLKGVINDLSKVSNFCLRL
jgi:hypothetical protein